MDKKHLFDNPRNVKRLLWLIYAICTGLVLLDFVFHRHVVHDLESIPGFYAISGFGGCALLVLVAKEMRKFLMRDEDYYDRDD